MSLINLQYSFMQTKNAITKYLFYMLRIFCPAAGAGAAIVLYIIKESSLRVYRGIPTFQNSLGVSVTKALQKRYKKQAKRDKT